MKKGFPVVNSGNQGESGFELMLLSVLESGVESFVILPLGESVSDHDCAFRPF